MRDQAKARGGYARARALSAAQRTDIARRAARTRWGWAKPRLERKMKPKRVPVAVARQVADEIGAAQVILIALTTDNLMHVVTYGRTPDDCQLAAASGNNLKRHMGFPEVDCHDVPARRGSGRTTPLLIR